MFIVMLTIQNVHLIKVDIWYNNISPVILYNNYIGLFSQGLSSCQEVIFEKKIETGAFRHTQWDGT